MPNVDRDSDIHTCSYYCIRPECIRRQRDELRDQVEQMSRRRQAQRIAGLEAEIERLIVVIDTLKSELDKPRAEYWPTAVFLDTA